LGKFAEKLMQGKVEMATVSVKLASQVLFVVFVGKTVVCLLLGKLAMCSL